MKKWVGADYCERQHTLETNRRQWEALWEDIAKYVYPRRQGFLTSGVIAGVANKGQSLVDEARIYDSSAIYSNEMLASGIHGMLTNPSQEWWQPVIPELVNPDGDTLKWLQSVYKILAGFQTNPYGGFSTVKHEVYLDFTAFGTGVQYIHEQSPGVVVFQGIPLSQCFLDEGPTGNIDTVYRRFILSVRNTVQMFGVQNVSNLVRQKFEKKLLDEDVPILHCVQPNFLYSKKDRKLHNFPFTSAYIDRTERKIMKESGYYENPFQVPRFFKSSGEIYGRSPAMTALPDIKMLNQMQKTLLKAGQKAVDPPWTVPNDGMFSPVRAFAGGMSYYRSGGDRPQPIAYGSNIPIGLDMVKNIHQRIYQMFYLDQLQFGDNPQMTATEVNQRTEDRLRLLGPVNGRLQQELLGPEIDRLFGIALRANLLPEAPPQAAGHNFDINYVSPLSLAPRQLKAQAFARVLEIARPLIELNPEVFDKINSDEALEYLGEMYNLDRRIFNDKDVVQQIRKNRQAQQQAQADVQNTRDQAGAAKNIASAMGSMADVEQSKK